MGTRNERNEDRKDKEQGQEMEGIKTGKIRMGTRNGRN